MKGEWMYHKVCPFCGKSHTQRIYINIICPCGAKYYFRTREWLNRRNGEWRADNGNQENL